MALRISSLFLNLVSVGARIKHHVENFTFFANPSHTVEDFVTCVLKRFNRSIDTNNSLFQAPKSSVIYLTVRSMVLALCVHPIHLRRESFASVQKISSSSLVRWIENRFCSDCHDISSTSSSPRYGKEGIVRGCPDELRY
jgi:hypothetical protein